MRSKLLASFVLHVVLHYVRCLRTRVGVYYLAVMCLCLFSAASKKRFPTTGGSSLADKRETLDSPGSSTAEQTMEQADSGLGLDTKVRSRSRYGRLRN